MRIYNLTFVLILGYYIYVLSQNLPHSTYNSTVLCGPFPTDTAAKTPLVDAITSTTVTSYIWNNIFYYAPAMWLVILLLYTLHAFKSNHLAIALKYIDDREDDIAKQTTDQQRLIARLRKQIQMGKNVVLDA